MKQKEYRETYSLAQNAPHQIDDDASEGTPWSGGVLNAGRVVLDQQAGDKRPNGSVSAYAEGIGVISLDSRFLSEHKD
jgi:hypothetical protein